MKIYLIIVEEPFFHPNFINKIIKEKREEVIGISLVPDISPKKNIFKHFLYLYNFFGLIPFLYLGFKTVFYKIMNNFADHFSLNNYYSVQSVARKFNLPVYFADNVNSEDHLKYLSRLKPDVIISAQGQIFKKELLSLPAIACINRHSAMLPRYGGLWPVFWAMLNGEENIGVTVHTMTEKIDGGKILAQKAIKRQEKDSMYGLYKKAFAISGEVVLEALERLKKNPVKDIPYNPKEATYFSNPKKEDIKLFRENHLTIL